MMPTPRSPFRRDCAGRALFGGLVLATTAAAQTLTLPPVHVTALLPDDPGDLPGAAVTMDTAEIARWRPPTLHEALGFLPGLRVIDDDIAGRRSAIGIRAAPPRRSRKVLLLEDGVPVNAATYLDPSSHYTPPLERIAQVDVLKGAGHLVHGPINNHGIVNFRNHRPTARPATVLEVAAGGRSTFRRHVRHSRTDGRLGLVLAYTGFTADGVFDVERTRFDDFFASADWEFTDQHRLRLALTVFRERSHYDESNLTPAEYVLAPHRKRGRFGQEHNTFALDHHRLDLVHSFEGFGTSWSARAFGTSFDRPRFTVDPGETPVALLPEIRVSDLFDPATGAGQMVGRDRYYRSVGAEFRLERRAGELDGAALQTGVRAERQWLNDRRTRGAGGEILSAGRRGTRTRDDAYRASAASAFVRGVREIAEVQFSAGFRLEHYSQSRERRSLAADPGPHPPGFRREQWLVLPALAARGQLGGAEWFAHAGRGYTPAFARTAEDLQLAPETGINLQVGARRREPGPLRWEISVFHSRVRDTVVQMPFSLDQRDVYLNSADSASLGADLELRWSAEVASALTFFAAGAGSVVDARFRAAPVDRRRVPEVARQTASLTAGFERAGRWHASLTFSHIGDFLTDPANTRAITLADENGRALGPGDMLEIREPAVFGLVPAHTTWSGRISCELPDGRGTLWLQCRNLTDRQYVVDLQNGLRPGAPRTLTTGLTLRY